MLRIDGVELQDFGPFKGRQVVDLPEAPGVVVVYGENMRGKTSLLNAIRFALFGKVLSRASLESSLHEIGNWEQADAGRYGFEVVLKFQANGRQYRLTRSCRPRAGVVPSQDNDYEVEHFLRRDGDVLGPGDAASELERIMPEQIARFFLFDGELLQEYEGLLRNESDMGRQISEAIERILGVPVLTRSRTTLKKVLSDYEEAEAKTAQSDTLTRELGAQMHRLHEKRRGLEDGLNKMRKELTDQNNLKVSLESELRRSERLAAMMDKLDSLRDTITQLDDEIATQHAHISIEMSIAWKPLVATRAAELIDNLRDREHTLQVRKMRHEVLRTVADPGGALAQCPTCFHPLSNEALAQMTSAAASEVFEMEQVEGELRAIQRRLDALEDAVQTSSDTNLRVLWGNLRRLERSRFAKQDEASERERRLGEADADEGALRRARSSLEQTLKKIGIMEEGIGAQERLLAENEQVLEKVRTRLERMGGADVEGARQRRGLCNELHSLFDDAVDEYCDRLRKRVEADAIELFLQLTTEPEYSGLRINESYGLTILHRDGSEIPVRSAGAEHVVALSLLGALQRNAPLQGPIFIDSPFGRLDTRHTRNVVAALPNMTEQVCLLVYDEELRPGLAHELLKGRLRAEYRLDRVTARHTELTEIRGDHG
ncbi:MAG: AAA family ATPase [Acidimicrobiaceae bacterium]|nr:AAA family ATPase [Acidimicrobiaceae bacterium]